MFWALGRRKLYMWHQIDKGSSFSQCSMEKQSCGFTIYNYIFMSRLSWSIKLCICYFFCVLHKFQWWSIIRASKIKKWDEKLQFSIFTAHFLFLKRLMVYFCNQLTTVFVDCRLLKNRPAVPSHKIFIQWQLNISEIELNFKCYRK